jgi:predicted DNA-binding protein (UPF0251 family)
VRGCIIESAHRKVADALVHDKSMRIEGGGQQRIGLETTIRKQKSRLP